jgi:cytoskeletal protein CcmA (bactofilin family)
MSRTGAAAAQAGIGKPDPRACPVPRPDDPETDGKKDLDGKLIIGRGVEVACQTLSCGVLLVHGTVSAMIDCAVLKVTESGRIEGPATAGEAELDGCFTGDLTVNGRLIIHAKGEVTGTLRYGTLEIKRGGRLGGDAWPLFPPPPEGKK